MKTILWTGSVLRATPEERAARRPIGRDPQAWSEMLKEQLVIAGAAEEAGGIEAIATTEHHFQTEGGETIANSLLMYGYLASLTKKIKYMPLSMILPVRDPIRTAEDLAMWDQLYPGRLNGVGFARGYQPRWMQTLGQMDAISATWGDPAADARNRELFEERIEIVQKAWSEDAFNHAGPGYQVPYPAEGIPNWPAAPWTRQYGSPDEVDEQGAIKKIGIVPKPLETPRIFIPTVKNTDTLTYAARKGFVPLSKLNRRKDTLPKALAHYRKEARTAGHEFELGQNFGVVHPISIGETYDEAFEFAVRGIGYWFNNLFGLFGMNEGLRLESDDPNKRVGFKEDRDLVQRLVDLGEITLGTPESVVEDLLELKSCYGDGVLEWFVWVFWGQGLAGDENMEIAKHQIELFGKHVAPAIA